MKTNYSLQKWLIVCVSALLFNNYTSAQTNIFPSTGSAGIGTTTPNASSILEMVSTSKGLLVPRMTKNQRDAIVKPAVGLLIYQTNSTTGFYYYNGTVWTAIVQKKFWSLTGNAATDPAVNFIGTTDAQPLIFKVNNQKAGYIAYDPIGNTGNTGFGYQTLNAITSGYYNTANGYQALYSNTTGNYNTAYGYQSLYSDTSGYANIAIGSGALYANTTGNSNTAIGLNSLHTNTTGIRDTATGFGTLFLNTTGYNTAYGYDALYHTTTGGGNTANGEEALFSNTTGYGNTANGIEALFSNTKGGGNTANGDDALFNNTTGNTNVAEGIAALFSNTTGSDNTAVGDSALYYNTVKATTAVGSKAGFNNTVGVENSYWGTQAGYTNSSGSYNNYVGFNAGYNATSNSNNFFGDDAGQSTAGGGGNTFIGDLAGNGNIGGSFNTYIGAQAFGSASINDATAIGYNAQVTASDQVRIGNTSIMSIGGYKAWTNLSDGRVKKNIKENVPGLAFINLLKPITYNIDLEEADKIVQQPVTKNRSGKPLQPSQEEMNARRIQEQVVCTGFIAQDVEATAKKIGYDFDGVDAAKNSKDLYGLRYSEFVVPLVKAVQELSAKNDDLKKQIDELKAMIVSSNQINTATTNNKQQTTNLSSAYLAQNIPNPFSNTTTINYSLPQKYSSAKIIVIDELGNTMKVFNLSGTGKGTINFSSPFKVGASYQYSLLVDGKLIDTKQMVLAK